MSSWLDPHPSLIEPELRRRSRLLGICVVVLGVLFGAVDLSLHLTVPSYQPPWFGYGLMLTTFLTNRAGCYWIAAPLMVVMFPAVIFTIVFTGHGVPFMSFGYLVIAPLVAAFFLPMWGVAVVTVVDLCGIALARLFAPEVVVSSAQLIGPLSANAMVGVLAMLYMNNRNGLESDRRRALLESGERLRLSLDAAQMGTWQLDCSQQELTLDARAQLMLGEVGRPQALIAVCEPPDGSLLRDALEATLAGSQPSFALAAQLRGSHTPRVVELTGRSVSDRAGRIIRVIGTIVDVTQRCDLEDQLRQAQKMEALGRLSGGIAHDFNNVLTVILANVALLRRRGTGMELDSIDKATRSAAALTSKLLAFSRGAVLAPRVLDLAAVVSGSISMIERLIGEDISIRYRPSPARWLTRIDGSQLEQVVLNLAANARDAMPNGGKLEIEVDNVVVGGDDFSFSHRQEVTAGPYVRLRVSDTGAGMNDETKRHLFEPFFTTKPRGKGTGLGLAMVFGTVSQSGGFIETQSTPGQGARFDLYFPRVLGAPPAVLGVSDHAGRGSETLLLAEDDDAVRKVIGQILESAGYRVLFAHDVAQARQIFVEFTREIALLITDEVMPGGRGSDLVAELRTVRPELRALCITGYIEPRTDGVYVELPKLQKPFEADLLLRKVRELLDERATPSRERTSQPRLG